MQLRKKQFSIYAKPDTDISDNIKHQEGLGWKLIGQSFTPNKFPDGRGEFILEFEELPAEPNDKDYDEFAGEEHFEEDGDTKAIFWKGQRIC
jgi:hypothetical protein